MAVISQKLNYATERADDESMSKFRIELVNERLRTMAMGPAFTDSRGEEDAMLLDALKAISHKRSSAAILTLARVFTMRQELLPLICMMNAFAPDTLLHQEVRDSAVLLCGEWALRHLSEAVLAANHRLRFPSSFFWSLSTTLRTPRPGSGQDAPDVPHAPDEGPTDDGMRPAVSGDNTVSHPEDTTITDDLSTVACTREMMEEEEAEEARAYEDFHIESSPASPVRTNWSVATGRFDLARSAAENLRGNVLLTSFLRELYVNTLRCEHDFFSPCTCYVYAENVERGEYMSDSSEESEDDADDGESDDDADEEDDASGDAESFQQQDLPQTLSSELMNVLKNVNVR